MQPQTDEWKSATQALWSYLATTQENLRFIKQELSDPLLGFDDSMKYSVAKWCDQWLSVLYDQRNELGNLQEILEKGDKDAGDRMWEKMLVQSSRDLEQMQILVRRLFELEDNPLGVTLVAESATNILKAFGTMPKRLRECS